MTAPSPTPTMTPPRILGPAIGKPNRAAARRVLALAGREILWTGNTFLYLTLSVFAARVIAKAVNTFLPQGLWERAPDLMRELGGAAPAPTGPTTTTAEEIRVDGISLYRHDTVYPGQVWPCPLLKPTACSSCEWFIGDNGRADYCAAIVKLRGRHMTQLRGMDLRDVRDHLRDSLRRTGEPGL